MREIEWTDASLEDMGVLDKGMARRVKQAVERRPEPARGLPLDVWPEWSQCSVE